MALAFKLLLISITFTQCGAERSLLWCTVLHLLSLPGLLFVVFWGSKRQMAKVSNWNLWLRVTMYSSTALRNHLDRWWICSFWFQLHLADLIYSLQSKAEIACNCQYLMHNNNFIARYVVYNFSLRWLVLCYRWKPNSWACCRQCRWLSFDEWLVKCWNKWKWSYQVFLRIRCKVRTNELFQFLFFSYSFFVLINGWMVWEDYHN